MSLNIALTSSSNMISFMLASDIVYSFLILLVSNSMEDSILSINGMKFRHIRFIKVFLLSLQLISLGQRTSRTVPLIQST